MILKSYIVEKDIGALENYTATLMYGENNGIKDDIKQEIRKKNKGCEIITFFENEILKTNVLIEYFNNQSLFVQKKIIFLQEISDKAFQQIVECIEKQNNDIQIYIFSANLEKKSKLRNFFEKTKNLAIFPCYVDNERTLITYITKELRGFKGITGEIINIIINNSNMDRQVIKGELEKIKDFFLEKKIDKTQILEILNVKIDSGFDEIRDKALMGEKDKINKLLSETEILNDEVFFYLNILNYRVVRLREITKNNEIMNNYAQTLDNAKPPIFWKDKPIILKQLQKCSKEKIEEILIKIAETEVLMKKNSYLRNDVVMKNLIINLTNKISTIS